MSFPAFFLLMLDDNKYKIYSQTSRPYVLFSRINSDTGESYDIYEIGRKENSQTQLLSYSFSRSVNSLYGEFEIQIKDNDRLIDKLNPLDVVYIYEKKDKVSFIGIIKTLSLGATAGAYNKSVYISGVSVGALFEMMNLSTDATSLSFFINSPKNQEVTDTLTLILQNNIKEGKQGLSFKEAFNTVYNKFVEVMTNKTYAKIAASGIYSIIKNIFGEPSTFLKSDNLSFYYQIVKNLYDTNEINIYSYFKSLLPEEIYELYETIENGKPYLIARRHPFSKSDWQTLEKNKIVLDPALITDYTLSRSCENVYTSFFAMIEGSSLSTDFYKIISSSESGNASFTYDLDKTKKYGYRPLISAFNEYAKPEITKAEKDYLNKVFKDLSNELKDWYSKLDEMYTGDVTIILNQNDKNTVSIGNLVQLCSGTFYVTQEKHNWNYESPITINYTLERGGNYINGTFSKLQNISARFSELLEKE